MHRENATEIRTDIVHGHSRLTWLMDEIDAHLRAWTEAPEAAELILDELVVYWTQFRDELREHIDEEEAELFPMVSSHVGCHQEVALCELRAQHARLLFALESVDDAVVELLGAEPEQRGQHLPALAVQASELRRDLMVHSRDEREFLRDVKERIADGCLSA